MPFVRNGATVDQQLERNLLFLPRIAVAFVEITRSKEGCRGCSVLARCWEALIIATVGVVVTSVHDLIIKKAFELVQDHYE